VTVIK